MEVSDYLKEKTVNDLHREVFITKILRELTTDLVVCKLLREFHPDEALEPIKEWLLYIEKIKKEIDDLYERVSNR